MHEKRAKPAILLCILERFARSLAASVLLKHLSNEKDTLFYQTTHCVCKTSIPALPFRAVAQPHAAGFLLARSSIKTRAAAPNKDVTIESVEGSRSDVDMSSGASATIPKKQYHPEPDAKHTLGDQVQCCPVIPSHKITAVFSAFP